MPGFKLLTQIQGLAEEASVKAEEYSGIFETARGYILDNFGQNGLYAAYFALAVLVLFIASRIFKLTFSAVKYLIIPSVALAFIASIFFPFSFAAALPVSVTVCSLFLLFRG